MEVFSLAFLGALATIVVIDLVLAGDNAIVIALASRKLPAHLQKKAILWGTVGAIVTRSALTLVVVWLLKIPGLMLIGGLLLVLIAYRLLLPEGDSGNGDENGAPVSLIGAIQTIVVADVVMGLDNVLAVAGAAHGSYLLVGLGLLISVPIVVWGSTIMLRWVERYPVIVYIGAGVLAMTAAKMIVSEPHLKDLFTANLALTALVYVTLIGGVLWRGFVKNHQKLDSRITARLAALNRLTAAEHQPNLSTKGESTMLKVLVPVDGSPNAEHAVRHVANEYLKHNEMQIHLLNVQSPLTRHISRFLSKKARDSFHSDEAQKALMPAKQLLEKFGLPFTAHYCVANHADGIVEQARQLQCDRIVMSTARKNSLTRMLEDSTTNRVLEKTTVPVVVIAGDAVSRFERYGLPASFGAMIALLFAAVVD